MQNNSHNDHEITYKNPIRGITNIGDPFVLKANNYFYMYATSKPDTGFKVWRSPNLVDWEEKGMAYDKNQQPNVWGTGDFWAPEVIEYKNQYYMNYSARNKKGHLQISIATSKDPLGPFIDISTEIVHQEGSYIDGHMLIDEDGTPYLYYVKDCSENIIDGNHVSQIFVQQMNEELTELLGSPQLLIEQDHEWEGLDGNYQWNEGPFVLKHQHKYYLMYSANFFGGHDYSVGYATSDYPTGPFVKAEENPILAKDLSKQISGPGHNSVTIGPDNKTSYIVYHIHTDPEQPSGDRQMSIDRLYIEDGKLKVDGPTASEQTIQLS